MDNEYGENLIRVDRYLMVNLTDSYQNTKTQ